MYSGETTVSKDILESVLRGGDILKIRGLWRPKEDDPNKKMVKLHQKQEPVKQAVNVAMQQNVPEKPIDGTKTIEATKEKRVTNKEIREKQQEEVSKQSPPAAAIDEKSKNSDDGTPYLVIKEEPIEWNEVVEGEMELVDDHEFHSEMTIKPEVLIEPETPEEQLYTPLTCELCSETFMIPAEWVRHIQTHTDMLPAKRQRRGRASIVRTCFYAYRAQF